MNVATLSPLGAVVIVLVPGVTETPIAADGYRITTIPGPPCPAQGLLYLAPPPPPPVLSAPSVTLGPPFPPPPDPPVPAAAPPEAPPPPPA